MDVVQAVILGIVQGLTEFIPVSSSAHLVLIPHFFGWSIPPVTFDVILHFGTLLAVLIYFRKDIVKMLTGDYRLLNALIIACIPTFFIGAIFKDFLEGLFENPLGVSALLLITGFILWISPNKPSPAAGRRPIEKDKEPSTVSFINALWIGFAQGAAIAPGISRSGATIVTGLFLGLTGENAVRFSFLLSIPAILGALVFKLKDFTLQPCNPVILQLCLAGGIAAAVSGYFAIKIVFKTIKTGKFKYFAFYCWVLGIIGVLSFYNR
jgi:undecaprenyl-diphosphatase